MNKVTTLDELHQRLSPNTRWQKVCIGLFTALTGVPALEMNGFGGILPPLSLLTWVLICAVLGAFIVALYFPDRRWWAVGLLPGALMGVLSMGALYFYTQHRSEVYSIELVLVALVGILPGAALYYVLLRALVLDD
jgi:predicted RND superfamily exporter protein